MKCGSQIAVAVVGGYVLGRSRKTRLAAFLALMAAGGGKLPVCPEELLRKSPLGGQLDELTTDLRAQLVDVGMSVAKKAASSRLDSLGDRLQERAETLRGTQRHEEPEEAEERPRRRREEPPRRDRDRWEPSRREGAREPEYDEDAYDEDAYDEDAYDEDGSYEDDRGEYEGGGYEPERRPRRDPRPRPRSPRPEPRRRTREEDRPRMGRTPR